MQNLEVLNEASRQLIDSAVKHLRETNDEPLQVVSAAARSRSGEVYVATNLYHFTGGPDAEAVILANTLYKDKDLIEIVAVHFDDNGNEEIINACGRCRQMLNDYTPDIYLIVGDDGWAKSIPLAEALPYSYRNKATEYKRDIGFDE